MTLGSAAHRNDGSVLFRHHVIPIDLPPLMSLWRTAKVVLLIVDLIASVPVFRLNLCARLPFLVLLIGVVVRMILGHGGHAGQSHCQQGECEYCLYRFHRYSCGIQFRLGKRCGYEMAGVLPAIASRSNSHQGYAAC